MAEKLDTIAVVGGGIAGLTLTLGLLHENVPVTLYESAEKFGEIGAGVAFGPNATRAMQLIDPAILAGFENRRTENLWPSKKRNWFDFRYGVGKRLKEGDKAEGEIQIDEDGTRLDNRRVGEVICSLQTPPGRGTVHRAHFLDEMVKLLPDGIARFGKRLVDLTDEGPGKGAVLRFADGSEARHVAVIGTDGIKSRTRELLLGEEHPAAKAFFSGKYAYRALIPMKKAEELLGEELANNSQMYFGYHGHVLTFPIEKGKTMNVVAFRSRETWDDPEWVITVDKQTMKDDFRGWSDHVQNIISNVEKPNIWALFMHPPAPTYYKGRVCILGDAAHASTPHCGAGAGMAIEDSFVLSGLMGQETINGDLEAAFKAYDAVRRGRSQKLVTWSKRQAEVYEFEVPELGDDQEKVAAELRTRMGWIWNEDLSAEARLASDLLKKFKGEKERPRL